MKWRLVVLTPMQNALNLMALRRRHRHRLALDRVANKTRKECRERRDVLVNAGLFERGEIFLSRCDRHDCPWIAARREHRVHQKPTHPAVSVDVGMDINKDEMPEHHAGGG